MFLDIIGYEQCNLHHQTFTEARGVNIFIKKSVSEEREQIYQFNLKENNIK